MNDVSVILVSYNTKEMTKNCIESVYAKTKDINFDILCVDNNSTDGTCEMIEQEFPSVKLIKNDKNLGFGAANNIAIKQSNAKYIFFLNTDTVLRNNAIKILFDFMEENSEIGACGGNLYDSNLNHVHSYGWFPTIRTKFLKTFLLDRVLFIKETYDRGKNESGRIKQVDYITGADLMIRRDVLNKCGYFDEDFFLYYEETELQYRINKAGYKVFINPNSQIFHLEGKSSKNRKKRREYLLKSEYLFYKKCYKLSKYSPVKIVFMISHFLRLFTNPSLIFRVWKYIWSL